jgi:hypothetical protein
MTHTRYGRSLLNLNGQLTNTRRSDGAPEPDGTIKVVSTKKILHYRQLYIDRSEPIAFIPVGVDTSGRIYDDFLRLLFLHAHRESSALANDIPIPPVLWFLARLTRSRASGVTTRTATRLTINSTLATQCMRVKNSNFWTLLMQKLMTKKKNLTKTQNDAKKQKQRCGCVHLQQLHECQGQSGTNRVTEC